MAGRFFALLMHETRLQWRYGIYYAYPIVIALYIAVLIWIDPFLPDWAAGLVIFTDPSVLGFFFLGALMLLEKAEGVRVGLAVTPVGAADYFWAKAIPLTGLAIASVVAIALVLGEPVDWRLLPVVTALTSLHYLGLGVPTTLHFKTVSSYLMGAAGLFVPIIGPGFVALLDDMPAVAIIVPAASQFRLILVATGARGDGPFEIGAMLAVSVLAAILTVWWATHRLEAELGAR